LFDFRFIDTAAITEGGMRLQRSQYRNPVKIKRDSLILSLAKFLLFSRIWAVYLANSRIAGMAAKQIRSLEAAVAA